MSSFRAGCYRAVFLLAALYNLGFGLWAALTPTAFFTNFELEPPRYPAIWACLGMVIGLYGAGYGFAARRLDRAFPFIAIGLAGKVLGPIGWSLIVARGEWPLRTLPLIVFNDLIWWLPFALFLLDGTGCGARVRALAPVACAGSNLVAVIALATVLRPGTSIEPDPAARLAYVQRHLVSWRLGWASWMVAAISLIAFYAWWGERLRRRRLAFAALAVACAGLVCDLLAESLWIGWPAADLHRLDRLATVLTGGVANGLYTIAGIVLTLATGELRGVLRMAAWWMWAAGLALSAAAFAGSPLWIAAATGMLFMIFCPWVILVGRVLR
jgi:hypothetical protein